MAIRNCYRCNDLLSWWTFLAPKNKFCPPPPPPKNSPIRRRHDPGPFPSWKPPPSRGILNKKNDAPPPLAPRTPSSPSSSQKNKKDPQRPPSYLLFFRMARCFGFARSHVAIPNIWGRSPGSRCDGAKLAPTSICKGQHDNVVVNCNIVHAETILKRADPVICKLLYWKSSISDRFQ